MQQARVELEQTRAEAEQRIAAASGTAAEEIAGYRATMVVPGREEIVAEIAAKVETEDRVLTALDAARSVTAGVMAARQTVLIETMQATMRTPTTPDLFRMVTAQEREGIAKARALRDTRPVIPVAAEAEDAEIVIKHVGLSIDGGGIRGIIPALAIQQIEEESGHIISDLIDFVAGTSIGGITALGVTTNRAAGEDPYRGEELAQIFSLHGTTVFSGGSLLPLFDCKYSADGINRIIANFFGAGQRLSETVRSIPVIITATTKEHEPHVFRSANALASDHFNYYTKDVARATSAAPIYFSAHTVKNVTETLEKTFLDGGLWCNHPARQLYDDMINTHGVAAPYAVVSLGTGIDQPSSLMPHSMGFMHTPTLIDGMFRLHTTDVHDAMTARLGSSYYRVQPDLSLKVELDSASEEVIDYLTVCAEQQFEKIEEVMRFLLRNKGL